MSLTRLIDERTKDIFIVDIDFFKKYSTHIFVYIPSV